MRFLIVILLLLVGVFSASAQNYTPKPGETVLKLTIEGRGNIFIKLHTKEAPKTTAHIIRLVKGGFYDTQRFFRVVKFPKPYLVQIGDPASRTGDLDSPTMGLGGSGARIPYEDSGFSNEAGAVGLSTPANQRDAGDSQFYMLLTPQRFLNGQYTVFGQIVAGMEVLQKIEKGDRLTSATILGG